MNPSPPPPQAPPPPPSRGGAVLVLGSGGSATVAGPTSAASGKASACGLPGSSSTTPIATRILVSRERLAMAGDVDTVVVIDSAPQAYFESNTPIGDTALAAVTRQVFEQLKVARDV